MPKFYKKPIFCVSLVVSLVLIGYVNASQYSQEAKEAIRLNQVIALVQENRAQKRTIEEQNKRIVELLGQVYKESPLQESLEAKVQSLSEEIYALIDELEEKDRKIEALEKKQENSN